MNSSVWRFRSNIANRIMKNHAFLAQFQCSSLRGMSHRIGFLMGQSIQIMTFMHCLEAKSTPSTACRHTDRRPYGKHHHHQHMSIRRANIPMPVFDSEWFIDAFPWVNRSQAPPAVILCRHTLPRHHHQYHDYASHRHSNKSKWLGGLVLSHRQDLRLIESSPCRHSQKASPRAAPHHQLHDCPSNRQPNGGSRNKCQC